MLDVQVRVRSGAAEEAIEAREEKARDLRMPFRVFDREVNSFARQQFDTAGSHGGEPWDPIQPASVSSRMENRGGADHPLWDTGRFRASAVEVGPESVRDIRRDRYRRGSLVGYAGFIASPRGPRPLFPDPVPPELTDPLAETMSDYFEGRGLFAGL